MGRRLGRLEPRLVLARGLHRPRAQELKRRVVMFGLGHTEVLIILGVGVLLFGARRLPELGRGLGRGMRGFRDALKGLDTETTLEPAKSEPAPEKNTDA